ncbi:MAG: DUF3857 domain-containing protein [Deltaproteobacteria bacterium]|nr:DUF3857 domain-containing protein [Deltaproteobacteria bacterium]
MAALALAALLAGPRAHAQHLGEEWLQVHSREASLGRRTPDGAVALLRLRALRDYLDPAALADRLRAFAEEPAVLPPRRALARMLEAETRRELGQLHQASALAAELGYLTSWRVIGPFDNEGRAGFAREYGPETDRGAGLEPDRAYDGLERPVRWRPVPGITRAGLVPLDALVRPSVNACAFAHSTVTAVNDGPAVLWLGATGAVAAYVNGALVLRDAAVRRAFPDRAGAPVRLRRGPNRVLLKVCTDDRGLAFYARLTRPDGTPLAATIASDAPEAAPTIAPLPAPTATLPEPVGVLAELRRRAHAPGATPEHLEALARWIHLTGSEDPASPEAADLAESAARRAPTAARWLLAAELASERNQRLQSLARAYALGPTDAHVLAALGHERRVGVYPEECVPYLEEALRRDPDYLVPRIEYALFLDGAGLPLRARALLEEASGTAPRAPALLRVRALLAERGQQHAEALALRRALLRVSYTDLESHEALAFDARTRGDRDGVRREVDRMLALRPDRLSVYTTAAGFLEAISDGDGALGVLARATELSPDEAGLWSARGALEARLQRNDLARGSMRRALALRPQDAQLRQHLEALEPAIARADEAEAEAPEALLARRQREAGDYNVRSLAELTVRTVYPNGLAGTFRQVAYQVANDAGARSGRVYSMQYDPDAQRFELRGARVFHPDGSVDESAQVGEYSVSQDGSARMFFNNRVVQVAFPRLAPGDVVEVRWRVDDVSPRNNFADYFGDLEIIQDNMPRARWRYLLRAPASRTFHTYVSPRVQVSHDARTEREETLHRWWADDVPAVRPEDHAPGATERAAYLHVSTYRTWDEVGRWYWGLVRDQLVLDDRLRGVVRDLTRGLTEPRDKVRAIYGWVLAHTRYIALEFGIHGFQPYSVPQVCNRGFGDCKDKASVIVTMLREAGIEASLVLLRTRPNGAIETSPASLAIFDHAIAYVPSLDLFLDGTAQHSGMEELPAGDQGTTALIVDREGGARLVQTPVYTPDRNTSSTTAQLRLAEDGSAALREDHELRGPDAGWARTTLEAQATRAERIEDYLREHFPGVRVTAVRTGDLTDIEQPARYSFDATVPRFGTREGRTWLFPPTAPLDLTRRFATRSARTHDLVPGIPSRSEQTRTIQLPAGAQATDLPPATHLESPFGRLDFTVEAQGQTLTVRRVFVRTRDRIPAQEYPAFRAFCQAVDEALQRRVTVRLATEVGR